MVHAVLLRFCIQFTRNYVIFICAFGTYYYPHKTVIILRNTIIINTSK